MAGMHVLPFLRHSFQKINGPFFYSLLMVAVFPVIWDLGFNRSEVLLSGQTIKWSIIVYPLFFASCLRYKDFLKNSIFLFLLVLAMASLYSLWNYITHFETINESYGRAKVMEVLAYSDHIRMSWATCISVILAALVFMKENNRIINWILAFYILFQFVYLHILGAKTGILSMYISLFILILGYGWKRNYKLSLLVMAGLLLSPVAAYRWIPSFYNRVQFIKYDYSHYMKGEFTQGLSDAIRIYSIRGGLDLLKSHPGQGVGFCKLSESMSTWYHQHTPWLQQDQYFVPISEGLIYGAGGGIVGVLVIVIFCLTGFWQFKSDIFGLSFFIPLVISFLYENHLETQTGAFVFGFSLGLFMVLNIEKLDN